MISINFIKLFTVEILNQYYANQLCKDFSIIPSAQTAATLGGYDMVYKQYDNRLYLGIKSDANNIPDFAPDEGTQFVFFLKCNNPVFFNFTNSPTGGLQGNLLYFSNKNDNAPVNSKLLISAGAAAYGGGNIYNPGDLVLSGGAVYEAIKTNTGVAVTDTATWMPVDSNSYVSGNDIKHIHQDVLQQTADPNDLTKFLPAADYAELLRATNVCGVINIVNDGTLLNGYNLLSAGKATSPLYTINFLNRATKWKYILAPASTGTIVQIAPVSATPAFPDTTVLSNSFISAFPLRLTEAQPAADAFKFQLTTSGGQTIKSLPFASPETLALPENIGDPYYSDIYLNY
jgi:hypothetical protein